MNDYLFSGMKTDMAFFEMSDKRQTFLHGYLSPFQASILEELKGTFAGDSLIAALKSCKITEDSFDDSVAAVFTWLADHQRPDGSLNIKTTPAAKKAQSHLKFILPNGKNVELTFSNDTTFGQMADTLR
jgi:hypothetical protein